MISNTQLTDLKSMREGNLLRVIYLGLCFMMLFTADFAMQNLMTQIFLQLGFQSLGQVCYFVLCFSFAIFSFITPNYYKKISMRIGMALSASFYGLFIFAGLLTTYCAKYKSDSEVCNRSFLYGFNVLTAGLCGTAGSSLWLYQTEYVNRCADDRNRGLFNGIFMALFQSSQILSSVLATIILGTTDQFTFFVVLFGFVCLAGIMFLFIKAPIEDNSTKVLTESSSPTLSLKEGISDFIETLKNKKYTSLLISTAFIGVAVSFFSLYLGAAVSITIASNNANEVNKHTGIVFFVLAVFEVIAGVSVGKLADKYDKVRLLSLTMIISEAALLFTVMACISNNFSAALVAGAMWGYGDTAVNTMINVIIGGHFNADPKLFSAYRCIACVGSITFTPFAIFLSESNPVLFIAVTAGMLLGYHTLFFYYHQEKSGKDEMNNENVYIEMKERILN